MARLVPLRRQEQAGEHEPAAEVLAERDSGSRPPPSSASTAARFPGPAANRPTRVTWCRPPSARRAPPQPPPRADLGRGGGVLGQHVERLGALGGGTAGPARPASHRRIWRRGRGGRLAERLPGHGGRRGVERVDAQGQRLPHCRVVVETPGGGREEVLGEGAPGPDVDAEGEVDARAAERGRGVQPAARQVEAVAGARTVSTTGSAAAAARTASRRSVQGWSRSGARHGRARPPVLLARDLDDETSCTS